MLQEPQTTTFTNTKGKEARYFESTGPITYYRWRQSLPNSMNNSEVALIKAYPDLEVDYIFREDGVVMQKFYRLLIPIVMVRFPWLNLENDYTLGASNKEWITEPQRTAAAQLDWESIDSSHVPDHIRYHHDMGSFLRPRSMKSPYAKFNPKIGWQRIELPDAYFIHTNREEVRRRLKYIKRKRFTIWLTVFVFFVWLTQPWLIPFIHNLLDIPYQLQNWVFSR